MAGHWKVLFEVVVEVPDVSGDEVVVVVRVDSVEGGELDVMAMDEATEDTGEEAIDVTPFGEATVVGLTLRDVKSSSKALLLTASLLPLLPPTSLGLLEVVTSLIWSLVELSGGETTGMEAGE